MSLFFITLYISHIQALFLNRLQLRAIRIKLRSLSKLNMMAPLIDIGIKKEGQCSISCEIFPKAEIDSSSLSSVQLISDEDFEETMHSDKTGLKIVLFTAKWCSPGNAMERNLRMSSLMEHDLIKNKQLNVIRPTEFYSIDTDRNPESCYKHNVRSIPCTLIFKDSEVVAEIVGTVPSSVIVQQIRKHSENVENENDGLLWCSSDNNFIDSALSYQ